MKLILQIFLFTLIGLMMESIECKKEVKFLSLTITPNPEYLENCESGVTPDSNGRSIDFKVNMIKDVTKNLHMKLHLYLKHAPDAEYKSFFDYDVNVCTVMDDFMSQTVARLWVDNLKKFTNIPFTCPVAKGEYYMKKLSVDEKIIPMVAVSGIYKAKVLVYIKNSSGDIVIANSTLEAEIVVV